MSLKAWLFKRFGNWDFEKQINYNPKEVFGCLIWEIGTELNIFSLVRFFIVKIFFLRIFNSIKYKILNIKTLLSVEDEIFVQFISIVLPMLKLQKAIIYILGKSFSKVI